MSKNAGTLLWNRMRITLPAGTVGTEGIIPSQTDVDTLVTQPNRAFENSSVAEPPLSSSIGVGSRVQVMPLAPTSAWNPVSHTDPFLDPTTDTVHVVFFNGSLAPVEINVLVWDPHTAIGPGQADTYNAIVLPPVLVP